jgi:isopenicillin N synthase-like dioxygenase
MKEGPMASLEVIDFSELHGMQAFVESLHAHGFAVLKNHGIDLNLLHKVYAIWQTFFKSEEKEHYTFKHETNAGFFSTKISEKAKGETVLDLKEYFHFYPKSNYYPEYTKDLTTILMNQMLALGTTMLKAIDHNAPADVRAQFSMPLEQMIKRGNYHLFRPIHYPPIQGTEPVGAIRAAAHTDINMLTLLFPSSSKGLQLQLKTGEWMEVPADQDWLVVNIGDMLDECSGGYYPATLHRVIKPEGEAAGQSRLSMPYFLHADDAVVLSKRHTAQSYRHERFVELGVYTKDQVISLDADEERLL